MSQLRSSKPKKNLIIIVSLEPFMSYIYCEGESRSVVSDSLRPHGLYTPWNSPGQSTEVGSYSFLQRIFPTQGSYPGLPHCWQILCQLSHKGSPRMLEWVAYPFSRESFRPRNQTKVSNIAGRFFTNWVFREALYLVWYQRNQPSVFLTFSPPPFQVFFPLWISSCPGVLIPECVHI